MRLWLVLLCDKIARKQHRTSAFSSSSFKGWWLNYTVIIL